jgi:ATP-dependent DNA helicase RecQ
MTAGTSKPMDKISIDKLLKDVFGFDDFLKGQRKIVEQLLAGNSALAVFPTGGGKSLCFQLPALILDGMTLVVSPLIALMKDQIDFLANKGIHAARLDSSLSSAEACRVLNDLWNDRLKILYVSPERFASERFVQRLQRSKISLMVIDEAHCISEWGHNFRPDYLKLASLARDLRVERVLALTATATATVADNICRSFSITPEAHVNTGFHRPNLVMRSLACSSAHRDSHLLECLRTRPRGATIVYVTRQKTAEQVAEFLSENHLPAKAYHAGMKRDTRNTVQDWFMASSDAIVVATIAFGMGIDKADVRYVYHYNMPKSPENYMQESGRAGRDGKKSYCDLLICPDDISTLENFSYGNTPDIEAVREIIEYVLNQKDTFTLSVYTLSADYDIRKIVVSTLLTYLELEGMIRSTGMLYNEYKFQPHRTSAEMMKDLDPTYTRFLKSMFSMATKAKIWFSIDIAATAAAMGEPRGRLVAALNYFEDQGDITLKVAGLQHAYCFVKRPANPQSLVKRIYERFQESEARDIKRIQQVVRLASVTTCTVRGILNYFGESLGNDCGHCDRCLGESIPLLPPPPNSKITEEDKILITTLANEKHPALNSPRKMTCFLCGLPSPAATCAGLRQDRRFGLLSHMHFSTVLSACGA